MKPSARALLSYDHITEDGAEHAVFATLCIDMLLTSFCNLRPTTAIVIAIAPLMTLSHFPSATVNLRDSVSYDCKRCPKGHSNLEIIFRLQNLNFNTKILLLLV